MKTPSLSSGQGTVTNNNELISNLKLMKKRELSTYYCCLRDVRTSKSMQNHFLSEKQLLNALDVI